MDKLNDNDNALRTVSLESVAAYLRCDPKRLVVALHRLSAIPSAIEISPGETACIIPALILLGTPAEEAARTAVWEAVMAEEAAAEEALMLRRSAPYEQAAEAAAEPGIVPNVS